VDAAIRISNGFVTNFGEVNGGVSAIASMAGILLESPPVRQQAACKPFFSLSYAGLPAIGKIL
jgi:hypothetical protein